MNINFIVNFLFVLFIVYFIYKYFIVEKFENCTYLSKIELEKTLINDSDNYYKNFNLLDYQVRNIKTIEEYYEKIKNSCINISNENIEILNECIKLANLKFKNFTIDGFNGKKAALLPWTIGLIKGNEYEGGYPHTRNYTIILPEFLLQNKHKLIQVLIHEKIHIYQKYYKEDMKIYLSVNGFKKYQHKNKFQNIRANPDIDNFVYFNDKNQMMRSIYKNNPTKINDVDIIPINDFTFEHPYEYMAYTIEHNIN